MAGLLVIVVVSGKLCWRAIIAVRSRWPVVFSVVRVVLERLVGWVGRCTSSILHFERSDIVFVMAMTMAMAVAFVR